MPSTVSSDSDAIHASSDRVFDTPETSPSLMDETVQAGMGDSAIVGMACRVPGAKSPEHLWKNIIEQKDLRKKIPADRFNIDAYYHPDGSHKGTMNARYGYFLDDDIREFDPEFFQISGKEAEAMDPQQRMLLEVVYEALENAGITLQDISGTDTSVFCGCFTNDYREMTYKDIESYPKYCATGTGMAILSNRISYFYNLHGPSVTMDTACSSSLVGMHMGNKSIRNGESDISIIVGSALHFDPTIFTTMTDLGFLSSDGRCRAFDADGKGYVRGEGICAVILKNKTKALRDGDNIRAVVKGTACNHDGTKEGITMPNSAAQEMLIRKIYKDAGLNTHETTYFEAHGTGTQAGDPRETRAIGSVFAPQRDHPLYVGSVKTNVGHLEGASGLAGIIKTVMSLEKGVILPNMHFNKPNPNVDFKAWKIEVPTTAIPWQPYNGIRRASINSFGYGGTNAHIIIEQYTGPRFFAPTDLPEQFIEMTANRPLLLPLSSHTEKAGKVLLTTLTSAAMDDPETQTADFAYSLSSARRSHHRYRSYAIANHGSNAAEVFALSATPWKPTLNRKPRIGFVFTGQGAQWYNMGRELFEKSPLFRQLLLRCEAVLKTLHDAPKWSIFEELSRSKEETNVNKLEYASALSPSLQLCVVELLKAWGITPTAVCGHSAGEIAASYAAGIITFEEAIACAWYRGTAFNNYDPPDRVNIPGAMIAVGMSEAEAAVELEKYKGKLCIAAINSPSSLTISGDAPECLELKKTLEDRKVFVRRLAIPQAYHSHHMVPFAPELLRLTGHVQGRQPKCRMFSSVTGRLAKGTEMGGKYFCDNLISPVRYSDALTGVVLDESEELNVDVLVEIGAHPALKGPSRQILQSLKLDLPYIGTITREKADFNCLVECAGQLYAMGYPVNLEAVNSDLYLDSEGIVQQAPVGSSIKLPSYPWDHGKYWSETRYVSNYRKRKERHAFLGAQTYADVDKHPRWRVFLRPRELPWLAHHQIDEKIIFPAAGYLSMAIEAATRQEDCAGVFKSVTVRDIHIKAPLSVSDSEMGTEAILEMQPLAVSAKRTSDTEFRFTISSYSDNGVMAEHCSGIVSVQKGDPTMIDSGINARTFAELQKATNKTADMQKSYKHWQGIGLGYGPHFQLCNGSLDSGSGVAMSHILLNSKEQEITDHETSIIHPSFLDASFHPFFASIESLTGRPLDGPWVPTFIKSLKVSAVLAAQSASKIEHNLWTTTETQMPGPRTAIIDVKVRSEDGQGVLVEVKGLEATTLGGSGGDDQDRSLFFRTRWQPLFGQLAGTETLEKIRDLSELVDIFAHEHPDSKILHITPSLDTTASLLKMLMPEQRRRFANLTIAAFPQIPEENLKAFESNWSEIVNHSEPTASTYDLVVVSCPTELDVRSLLCPNGFVVADCNAYDSKGADRLFGNASLSVFGNTKTPSDVFGEPLTIVLPERPSVKTEEICSRLAKEGLGAIQTISLKDVRRSPILTDRILVLASLDEDLLFEKTDDEAVDFEAVRVIMTQSHSFALWVLHGSTMESTNPGQALINGMARSARNENDQLNLTTMDVSQEAGPAEIVRYIKQVLTSSSQEDELVARHGTLFVPRIEVDDRLNAKLPCNIRHEAQLKRFGQEGPLSLKIGKVGLLETLAFGLDEEIIDTDLAEDDVEIEVKASAINFRDIAASTGIIDDFRLGDECSGIVIRTGSNVSQDRFSAGDRVVAFRPGQGAHRTIVRNHWTQCHKLDNTISFANAAAFPLVMTTAYYALMDLARLQKGETVLIHAAAGGVGQMAVQLAQMMGAKVFATCGSEPKRDLLKSAYGLKDDQIFSSRDASFAKDVMTATEGKGVDVVLNSLAGELLHLTWSCMARFGRFIEIGKREIHENASIAMDQFRKNVLFASADLITIWEHNKPVSQGLLKDAFGLLEAGKVKLPETVLELPYSAAERGFRLLQMGKHTGKIVLVPHKEDLVPVSAPTYRQKNLFKSDKVYLLVGGLGGLGRTLSQWMVRKGARRLAFLSRSGESKPEAQATVNWLRARNVETTVFAVDVTNAAQVSECIQNLGQDLAGIFHAAVVLQDVSLNTMSVDQWRSCLDPKVRGAWNLHVATKETNLDFFVTFSSLSCQLGGAGQANYSAANAFLDALMRSRRNSGLRGTTMNVGAIEGAGLVAENEALMKLMTLLGFDMVNEEELLYQIEEAVIQSEGPVSDERGVDLVGTITGVNLKKKDFYWSARSFFKNLYLNHDLDNRAASAKGTTSLPALLKVAATLEERTAILTSAFIEKTAAVLGAEVASIDSSNPLSMYGLDSIVAVEFRKWFSTTINVDVALFDILSSPSINALIAKAASVMVIRDDPSTATESSQTKAPLTDAEGANAMTSSTDTSTVDTMMLERPERLPMSNFQRRLWFAHQFAEDKADLNIAITAHMKGKPDFQLFKAAMDEWKKRNEMARVMYFDGDDFAEQKPLEDFDSGMTFEDLSAEADAEVAVEALTKRLQEQPLDIEEGEVFRASLAKLADDHYAFVTAWHHISIDRGSSKSSFEQITSIYDALRDGKDLATVPSPRLSYIDFSIWYERFLNSGAIDADVKFWTEKLRGMNPETKVLPFAKGPRPEIQDLSRKTIMQTLPVNMLNRLKRVCTRFAATPFHFLLAAFRAFLYRYTEEKDLTMLIIDGNRPRADLEDVMGYYVNMVPVRINSDLDEGFDQLLRKTSKTSVEALEHNKMPFDTIVEKMNFPRGAARFPISQIVMNYQMHGKMPRFATKDFEINRVINHDIPSACEIAVEALEDPDRGMDLYLQYSTRLYDDSSMERFWDNFMTFVTSLTQDHMQPIDQVKIAGIKETEHLKTNFWNAALTKNDWEGSSILDRVYSMAEKSPNSIAIQTSDDCHLTYKELSDQAQRVAGSLSQLNVVPGTSVGVLSYPGVDAIVGMLGALSHGCGYLALDPEFAAQRLGFMATDSQVRAVLVGDGLEDLARAVVEETKPAAKIVAISQAKSGNETSRYANASLDRPFYTIYTSGSTGKPKGVVLTYGNTHQMLATMNHDYAFTATDRFLHQSSICFDLSIVQIFSALTCGAIVCVATADTRKDPSALASFMLKSGVTITYFTPTHFSLLIDSSTDILQKCQHYRISYFAGERLPTRLVNRFYSLGTQATIYNTWSPSELVVQTSIAKVTGEQSEQVNIPIGFPMANCRHYILDTHLNPLPVGFIGELCVSGAQVGAGYLNRPEANAASFVEDPFCSSDDRRRGWTRLFRTGDKGRFLPDGQLEFHGRIAGDKQIKLRGFRVDLGEVEHRIYREGAEISSPQLLDLSIVARHRDHAQSETDDRLIVAFLVVKQSLQPEEKIKFVSDIHRRIGKHLNSYMLPTGYEFLDKLPLTIGRKVDRQSLLNREINLVMPNTSTSPPATTVVVEDGLQQILDVVIKTFRDVLRLPADRIVSAHDNFFEIGGSSILVLQLHSRLKRAYKPIPSVPEFFKAANPFLMSQLIWNFAKNPSTPKSTVVDKMRLSRFNWAKEASLPEDDRYQPGNVLALRGHSEVKAMLVTGLESFIGIHVFAALLKAHPHTDFYILGEDGPWEMKMVLERLEQLKLLDEGLTRAMLSASINFVPGRLMKPHFGLERQAFADLGKSVQAIYHFGAHVSLLKSYSELKRENVNSILDLIELASYGLENTSINCLSTWSVPHLQSHRKTKFINSSFDTSETSAANYEPSDDAELFYFKSRWVAERLLTHAAKRGFNVSIFRTSAVSGNTETSILPPQEDLVKRMIVEMINTASIVDFSSGKNSVADVPPFAIDFIPVNYVADAFVTLSTSNAIRADQQRRSQDKKEVLVYHICNPAPLPLTSLPELLPQIRKDGRQASIKKLDRWLADAKAHATTEEQKLRVEAAKAICDTGHIMFALDGRKTREALELARHEEGVKIAECPPVDVGFLQQLAAEIKN